MVTKHLVRLGLVALIAPALAGGIAVGSVALTGAATQASVTLAEDVPTQCQDSYDKWQAAEERRRQADEDHENAEGSDHSRTGPAKGQANREADQAKAEYDECVAGNQPPEEDPPGGNPFAEQCEQAPDPLKPVTEPLCAAAEDFPSGPEDLPVPISPAAGSLL